MESPARRSAGLVPTSVPLRQLLAGSAQSWARDGTSETQNPCSLARALAALGPWGESGCQMRSPRWSVGDAVPSVSAPARGSRREERSEAGVERADVPA